MNELIIVNTFVLHALHRKIKHAAIVMRKLKKKLNCGGKRKRAVKVKKTYVDSGKLCGHIHLQRLLDGLILKVDHGRHCYRSQ